jgi:putative ABC transport system permease protein
MTAVTLKGLMGRKLRACLTAFAIVLGVAMVSGTYVLTDTMDKAFNQIFAGSYAGSEAVVSGKTLVEGAPSGVVIPQSVVQAIRGLPGVEAASGAIIDFEGESAQATLVGRDGDPLGSNDNPAFGFGFDADAERFNPLDLVEGTWADGPREVAIDAATARENGYEIGDPIGVATDGPAEQFEVVGIARFGEVDSLGGATIAVFDVATAQRLLGKDGVDTIYVAARDGVSPEQLVGEIEPTLPSDLDVQTGAAQAAEHGREVGQFVSYFRWFLLAFGAIALFVGAFVIFNTLSITVAQRTRELATLRTLGASRRQVLRSVVLEATAIGAVASVVGLFLGLGLAKLMSAAFDWLGIALPEAGTVLATRTIVVSLAVGTLIAVAASLVPAVRATRVAPISAVREGATLPPGRLSRFVPWIAVALVGLGAALVAYPLLADRLAAATVLTAVAGGCVLLFVGVAMISPRLVKPLARAVGWPGRRLGGSAGALATENAVRAPGRTAATAAALMIGLALVTLVAVLGKGLREANETAIERQVTADYVISSEDGFSPFSAQLESEVADALGLEATSVRADRGKVGESSVDVNGVDPETILSGYRFDWSDGSDASPARLGDDGALLEEGLAEDHGLGVGDRFTMVTPAGETLSLVVHGLYDPPVLDSLLGSVVISQQAFDAAYPRPQNTFTFLSGETVLPTAALDAAVAAYPDAAIQTRAEFVHDRAAGFSQFLNLLYVLLAFSVVVSLFGMVNTLVLSVHERTREIGMLRAIGMTRRQVRRMIRHESVITALIGAVLGIAIGVGLAALVTRAMPDVDVSFGLPVGTLAVFALVAIVAGVLAAVLPARRASRLNVLRALHYE